MAKKDRELQKHLENKYTSNKIKDKNDLTKIDERMFNRGIKLKKQTNYERPILSDKYGNFWIDQTTKNAMIIRRKEEEREKDRLNRTIEIRRYDRLNN